MRIRAARLADVPAIHTLIAKFVAQGILLPRSREAIERDVKYFLVAVENKIVVGCASLDVYEPGGLAEIRSLAVADEFQGDGLGARLTGAAVKKAKRLGVARVFAVTHSLAFFEKQGFVAIALDDLPEKLERYCCRCPRQGVCGQTGAMKVLEATHPAEAGISQAEKNSVPLEIVPVTHPAAPPS
jgi:amino-acid N-acetyltransferase